MIKVRCFDAFRTSDALSIYSLALSPFACPMASASPIVFAAAVVDGAEFDDVTAGIFDGASEMLSTFSIAHQNFRRNSLRW